MDTFTIHEKKESIAAVHIYDPLRQWCMYTLRHILGDCKNKYKFFPGKQSKRRCKSWSPEWDVLQEQISADIEKIWHNSSCYCSRRWKKGVHLLLPHCSKGKIVIGHFFGSYLSHICFCEQKERAQNTWSLPIIILLCTCHRR